MSRGKGTKFFEVSHRDAAAGFEFVKPVMVCEETVHKAIARYCTASGLPEATLRYGLYLWKTTHKGRDYLIRADEREGRLPSTLRRP